MIRLAHVFTSGVLHNGHMETNTITVTFTFQHLNPELEDPHTVIEDLFEINGYSGYRHVLVCHPEWGTHFTEAEWS